MADEPTKARAIARETPRAQKVRTPDDPSKVTGEPKPGDVLDNPTGSAADGSVPPPTIKNEPTAMADTGETRPGRSTSTGTPTSQSDEPPSGGQSSGARVASRLIRSKQEVDAEEERRKEERGE